MKAASAGPASARVRQARLDTAADLVRLKADALLVAGDTFEDNAVDRALIDQVAAILARFDGPVFVLPGNHDPLVPGSVWDHPAWGQNSNITVIREARAYALNGATLLAAPLRETHSRLDPTAWLETLPRPEGLVIAMSHGTVEGVDPDTEHHPIAAHKRQGIHYLALGHWHSTAVYNDAAMAYSGTHETTKFGERDSGNVLRVTIGETNAIERIPTGRLRWESIDEEIRHTGELDVLRSKLLTLPAESLVRIGLKGLLHAAEAPILNHIDDIGRRFLHYTRDSEYLLPADDAAWIETLPAGAVQLAASRLRAAAENGDTTAAEALLELQSIAAQAGVA